MPTSALHPDLDAILDAALDCVVAMDADGRILMFNAAAERTFGHRAADVIGRDMADVIVPPTYRRRTATASRATSPAGRASSSTAASS